MLYCKNADEFTYDRVSASLACDLFKVTGFEARPFTKRRAGQFSPEAGAQATAPTKSSVSGDFHSRKVYDIDRNLRRGVGSERRAVETTLEHEQEFSEEHHLSLRGSLQKLTHTGSQQNLPEFIHLLDQLGIECRRLKVSTSQLGMLRVQDHLCTDASAIDEVVRLCSTSGEAAARKWLSDYKDVVEALCLARRKSDLLHSSDGSSNRARNSWKEKNTNPLTEKHGTNVNTRRLETACMKNGNRSGKLPAHAMSKSLKRLLANADDHDLVSDTTTVASGETRLHFDHVMHIPADITSHDNCITIKKLPLAHADMQETPSICSTGTDGDSLPGSPFSGDSPLLEQRVIPGDRIFWSSLFEGSDEGEGVI
jgi:hypothetical protein